MVVATGMCLVLASCGPGRLPRGDPAPRGPQLPGLCGGEILELRDAARFTPYAILVPDHPLASEDTLESVEWCPVPELLAMSFTSGVQVQLSTSQLGDPAEVFARHAEAYAGTTVGTVRGVVASFTEPGSMGEDSVGPAPGGVEFVEDGVLIDVVGDGSIALEDMKAIAESLKAYAP